MKNSIFFLSFSLMPFCALPISGPALAKQLIVFPQEVSLTSPLKPDAKGVIQLDAERIASLVEEYEKNFALRHKLSYGSFAINAALIGIGLYQLGFLDFLIPGKAVPAMDLNKICPDLPLEQSVAKLLALVSIAEQRITRLEAAVSLQQPSPSRLLWLWNGVKYMGSLTMFALVSTKALQIKNYVEATPSFIWFFSRHSILDHLEVLRRSVLVLTINNLPLEYNAEYHNASLEPALLSLARNIEEFIAFLSYYTQQLDQELLVANNMESKSRYLFNASNDFFMKFNELMRDEQKKKEAIGIIDDFKSDMSALIKECHFFEKEVLVVE